MEDCYSDHESKSVTNYNNYYNKDKEPTLDLEDHDFSYVYSSSNGIKTLTLSEYTRYSRLHKVTLNNCTTLEISFSGSYPGLGLESKEDLGISTNGSILLPRSYSESSASYAKLMFFLDIRKFSLEFNKEYFSGTILLWNKKNCKKFIKILVYFSTPKVDLKNIDINKVVFKKMKNNTLQGDNTLWFYVGESNPHV